MTQTHAGSNKAAARRQERRATANDSGRTTARRRPPVSADRFAMFLPLLLMLATLLAYQQLWHAGFIWDDDYYVTQNMTLRDLNGLWRIWFEIGAVPQYYPLVHTVFWIEYHLWGLDPFGFHLVNILLHGFAAILFARLLTRLQVRGAWLAAFLFALHPVCVESVAWITELKNTLSVFFYFASALAYCRFSELQDLPDSHDSNDATRAKWGWYTAALLLFAAALLSKTVTCSLPVTLLLVRWWQKGRLRWADVVPVVPFFALGLALALQTVWIEKHLVRAQGSYWTSTLIERCLVAGRIVWFYASKLLVPYNLTFIYPRWQVDTAVWWQWLFPLGGIAVAAALWLARQRIGRGLFTGVTIFAVTLTPALGFIDVYPMRYSYVADHFQYLATIGLIPLGAAGIMMLLERLAPRRQQLQIVGCAMLLTFLGVLTWRQAGMYRDLETLWRATLARNPECPMALDSLGFVLQQRGQVDEAIAHYRKAIALQPEDEYGHNLLGTALVEKGQIDEGLTYLQRAVELQPKQAQLLFNFGAALLQKGRTDEAIQQFRRSLEEHPENPEAHNSLGIALFQAQQLDDARGHFEQALRIQPLNEQAHANLATVLFRTGSIEQAIVHFQKALQIRPDLAEAYYNLRQVAWVLATSPDDATRNGTKAISLAQQLDRTTRATDPTVAATLAAAYAEAGQFPEARAAVQRAMQLSTAQGNAAIVETYRTQAKFYEIGQPYREAPAGDLQYKVNLR